MAKVDDLREAYGNIGNDMDQLEREKSSKRRNAIAEIDRQLNEEYGERLKALSTARRDAKEAWEAERERIALEEGTGPYPVGTVLCEWDKKGRLGEDKSIRVLTGRKGIVEVVTRNFVMPDNLSYGKPDIGQYAIRLLKKDGTPSKQFFTFRGRFTPDKMWKPEGTDPNNETRIARRRGDKIMLWQLHQHFKDGRSEFYGQCDPKSPEDIQAFIRDLVAKHPLAEGAMWQMCNENMPCFRVEVKG